MDLACKICGMKINGTNIRKHGIPVTPTNIPNDLGSAEVYVYCCKNLIKIEIPTLKEEAITAYQNYLRQGKKQNRQPYRGTIDYDESIRNAHKIKPKRVPGSVTQ